MRGSKLGILIFVTVLLITVNVMAAENADNGKLASEAIQQPTRFDFSPPPYTEVVSVKGVSADELYYRAREWFSRAFKTSNNVLQMDSKERKTLIGKGSIEIPEGSLFGPSKNSRGFVNFTIAIYLKDGRYKYEIADAWHTTTFTRYVSDGGSLYKEESDGTGINNSAFKFIKSYSVEHISSLIDSLKTEMSNPGKSEKKDDW